MGLFSFMSPDITEIKIGNGSIVWRIIQSMVMSLKKLKETYFLGDGNMGMWPSGSSLLPLFVPFNVQRLLICLLLFVGMVDHLIAKVFLYPCALFSLLWFFPLWDYICACLIVYAYLWSNWSCWEVGFFCYLLFALFNNVF